MREALAPAGEDVVVVVEQLDRALEQIVEVHRRCGLEAALVLEIDVGDALLEDLRRRAGVIGGRHVLVLDRGDGGLDGAGREPFGVEVEVADDVATEADRVGLVVDREPGREPDAIGISTKDPHTGAVEGRHPHLPSDGSDQPTHSFLHLGRRLVGEGDGKDLEGRHALLLDHVRDAMGQDAGLSRARPGHDEQRPTLVDDRVVLGWIEAFQQGRVGHWRHPIGGL